MEWFIKLLAKSSYSVGNQPKLTETDHTYFSLHLPVNTWKIIHGNSLGI